MASYFVCRAVPRAWRTICAMVLVLSGLGAPPARAGGNYRFDVLTETHRTHADVYAVNQGYAPAMITVDLVEASNVHLDRPGPVTALVPPLGTRQLATIRFDESGGAARWHLQMSHVLGSDQARPTTTRYGLPLHEGAPFTVVRGLRDGHFRTVSAFAAPAGTRVVAAREGVVVELDTAHSEEDNATRRFDKANTITVLHDDGTLADYLYVAPRSESVGLGQRVRAGFPLASVGQSPLYFRVRQNSPQGVTPLAVSFVNGPDGASPVDMRQGSTGRVDRSGSLSGWLGHHLRREVGSAGYQLRALAVSAFTVLLLIVWTWWLRRVALRRYMRAWQGCFDGSSRSGRDVLRLAQVGAPDSHGPEGAFGRLKGACLGDVKMAFRLVGKEIRRAQPRAISANEAIEAALARILRLQSVKN